jgi:hypothetical protein
MFWVSRAYHQPLTAVIASTGSTSVLARRRGDDDLLVLNDALRAANKTHCRVAA